MTELVRPGGEPAVVVVAFPLARGVVAALQSALGAAFSVVDIRAVGATADIVLSPSASPQAIGNLRRLFTDAKVLVVELDDLLLGVKIQGPVSRIMDAGADAYVVASSTVELAGAIRAATEPARTAESAGALGRTWEHSLSVAADDDLGRIGHSAAARDRPRDTFR